MTGGGASLVSSSSSTGTGTVCETDSSVSSLHASHSPAPRLSAVSMTYVAPGTPLTINPSADEKPSVGGPTGGLHNAR